MSQSAFLEKDWPNRGRRVYRAKCFILATIGVMWAVTSVLLIVSLWNQVSLVATRNFSVEDRQSASVGKELLVTRNILETNVRLGGIQIKWFPHEEIQLPRGSKVPTFDADFRCDDVGPLLSRQNLMRQSTDKGYPIQRDTGGIFLYMSAEGEIQRPQEVNRVLSVLGSPYLTFQYHELRFVTSSSGVDVSNRLKWRSVTFPLWVFWIAVAPVTWRLFVISRRKRRRYLGQCVKCSYRVISSTSTRLLKCPECGTLVSA